MIRTFAGFCALLLLGLFAFGIYLVFNQHRRVTSLSAKTRGIVLEKHVEHRTYQDPECPDTYEPMATYRYEVRDQQFTSRSIFPSPTLVNDSGFAHATVARFEVGKSAAVYYNPNNPSEACLIRRPSSMLYLPLFAPVIILAFIAAIWGTPPAAERARYNRSKGRWIAAIWHAVGLASGIHYFYLAGTEYVAGAAWLFGCYTYVGLIPVAVALPSSELAQRVKNGIALSFAGTVGGILLGAAGGWLAALLTNRPNDILWVGYGGIIGAALLATLGMWLAPQPSPNAVGRMAAGNQPRIWRSKTEDDVLEFLLDATKDEALARFLVEVTQKTGRDGYLVVERGGNGSPYEAEYQEEGQDGRTISEVQAELESRKQALALAQSDSGRDRIKRQIAELVGGTCTIRINVISSYEFNRQKALIIDTWAKFREIVGRPETGSALGT